MVHGVTAFYVNACSAPVVPGPHKLFALFIEMEKRRLPSDPLMQKFAIFPNFEASVFGKSCPQGVLEMFVFLYFCL